MHEPAGTTATEVEPAPMELAVQSECQVVCAYMQGCGARAVPATLCTSALQYLMLSENMIAALPAELAGLENLRWAHLFGNRLVRFSIFPESAKWIQEIAKGKSNSA